MRDIKNLLSQTKPYLPSPPPMHHQPPPPPPTPPLISFSSSSSSSKNHTEPNRRNSIPILSQLKLHTLPNKPQIPPKKKKKHNQNLNPKKERCKSAITMATRECETKKVGRIFRRFPLTVAAPFCSKIPLSLSLSLSLS